MDKKEKALQISPPTRGFRSQVGPTSRVFLVSIGNQAVTKAIFEVFARGMLLKISTACGQKAGVAKYSNRTQSDSKRAPLIADYRPIRGFVRPMSRDGLCSLSSGIISIGILVGSKLAME